MNNDIKEILEEIKSYTEHEYLPPYCELAPRDCKILLDYITNLQEKNKELKKKITFNEKCRRKMEQSLMKQIETYKSRNEKAIEYIKSLCYIESKNEWFTYGDDLSPEHIVNILQGEDKDE